MDDPFGDQGSVSGWSAGDRIDAPRGSLSFASWRTIPGARLSARSCWTASGGTTFYGDERTVDTHVKRLRKKNARPAIFGSTRCGAWDTNLTRQAERINDKVTERGYGSVNGGHPISRTRESVAVQGVCSDCQGARQSLSGDTDDDRHPVRHFDLCRGKPPVSAGGLRIARDRGATDPETAGRQGKGAGITADGGVFTALDSRFLLTDTEGKAVFPSAFAMRVWRFVRRSWNGSDGARSWRERGNPLPVGYLGDSPPG